MTNTYVLRQFFGATGKNRRSVRKTDISEQIDNIYDFSYSYFLSKLHKYSRSLDNGI
jgi:hypothetical protein